MSSENVVLYGMQASLFTGKVRAYMRRNRIAVTERGAGHPQFYERIMPVTERFIMPIVQMPNGDIIQDGTDILDYFEKNGLGKEPLYPDDPTLKAIAHLFELFGNEGLLRPAMHYRWNFDADNLEFLKVSFADVFPPDLDAKAQADMFAHGSGRMRKAGEAFGVTPDVFVTIEESYAAFLGLLNTHLSGSYYLLGGRPTVADYGLFNPLYAHLSRDPKPAHIMKTTAPYVWNWVERMNAPEQTEPHTLKDAPKDLFAADDLPDSLLKLMAYIAEEYGAELSAHIDFANGYLAENVGPIAVDKGPKGRMIGFAEFDWRGHRIKTVVMPYRFYLLQRLHDYADGLAIVDVEGIQNLFAAQGLSNFLSHRTTRRVVREGYHESWADV